MGRISMPQGKGSQLHNRREYEKIGKPIPDNIDASLMHQNVVLVDLDIREAYESIFGEALQEYNSKQKRADRKIDDYYEHISKSKNGEKLFYEDVLQWGKMEDFKDNPQLREKAKDALIQYATTFQERNPNLRVIGAYVHMDEASPHLHLDYVPVAHGYTRGLKMRNSLDRAMKEMGYVPEKESRKNNATKLWKENERAYFAEICQGLGLEVEKERKARGSLSVEEYKEERDKMVADIEQEAKFWEGQSDLYMGKAFENRDKANELQERIDKLDAVTAYVSSGEQETPSAENVVIPEKKTILGKIEAPERRGVFIEDMNKQQFAALVDRVRADEGLEKAYDSALTRCNAIIDHAKEEAEEIRAEASAERNETVARAQEIINEQNSIIQRAKKWAEDLQRKYKELAEKVKELLGMKSELEAEIKEIKESRLRLEPLKKEVDAMQRSYDILAKNVEHEYTRAMFKDVHSLPGSYSTYRERGELIALYKDGSQRLVGSNEHGGMDWKTLEDEKAGLCTVGVFMKEREVKVPESLFRELIQARKPEKEVSQELQNLIKQETHVEQHVPVRRRGR